MQRCAVLLALAAGLSMAATLDRLAITVGNAIITELQVDEDLRVAALLNGQPVRRDLESRRAAADRLVEQLLIQHEIELSRYPAPSVQEVDSFYSGVEQTLGGAERAAQTLREYQISPATLRAHLSAQLATLRFIEFRFRPHIIVSDSEVDAAYQRESPDVGGPSTRAKPPLDAAARARLSNQLLEERTDAALNTWLAEARKQINIVYLDAGLR